jgi:NAD(P)-dependent dehydrogenase (short-subunit alcohol dehydrogenase family)
MLQGKTALITGASTGIGKGIAQRFLKEGAKVIVFGRNKPDYSVTKFYKVDVSNENQIKDAMKQIKKLDILVNNAGVLFLEDIEKSERNFDRTIDINLKGQFWTCKYALPLLKRSKGNIINISSIIGIMPAPDVIAYCISKAGVISLTKNLSQQYAPLGIRVNAILPGPIDTPMLQSYFKSDKKMQEAYAKGNPMRRIGKPAEIAAAAAFLASSEASYITGTLLPVDGGALASGG